MNRVLGIAGIGGVAAAAAYGGVFAGGVETFQVSSALPAARVQAVLARSALPPMVFGTEDLGLRTLTPDADHIVWVVLKDGAEVMRYTATLSVTADGGTGVLLDLAGVESGRFGNVRARLEGNPSIRNLYLTAMREQVAADLEGRPYDMSAISMATMNAVFTNSEAIAADLKAADEEYRRRDRENFNRAYADEARGVWR